ncbi:MAG TPA: hypothetical protein VKZ89_06535 [Thermobifida alba]|nr:hypothetical protein [Thermobifida alba]
MLLRLLTLPVALLLAVFAPARGSYRPRHATRTEPAAHPPAAPAPTGPVPRPQARAVPPRIPDYPVFAECAERHSALWEVTYAYGAPCPYTARNRVTGHLVAVSDVDLLDHVLTEYQPPHTVRAYCDRGRVRAYAPSGG